MMAAAVLTVMLVLVVLMAFATMLAMALSMALPVAMPVPVALRALGNGFSLKLQGIAFSLAAARRGQWTVLVAMGTVGDGFRHWYLLLFTIVDVILRMPPTRATPLCGGLLF